MRRPVWEEQFHIHTHEADANGLARLDALFCCFQEAAGHHARNLGVGREDLARQGCLWVLSRCWMQVDRYPAWGQRITVQTWPCGVERAFALRDFRFLSEAGEQLASGVSAWLIVSQDKHRPLRPGPYMQGVSPTRASAASDRVLEKQANARDLGEMRLFSVRYSDLDVNRHVNNAAYVRWILDSFDAPRHDRFEIGAIRIDYLSETVLGETVRVEAEEVNPGGGQVIIGMRPDVNQSVFQAAIAWRIRPSCNR